LFVIGLISTPIGKLPEFIIGLDFSDITFWSSWADIQIIQLLKKNTLASDKWRNFDEKLFK